MVFSDGGAISDRSAPIATPYPLPASSTNVRWGGFRCDCPDRLPQGLCVLEKNLTPAPLVRSRQAERDVSGKVPWRSPNVRVARRSLPLSVKRRGGWGVRLSRRRGERISPAVYPGQSHLNLETTIFGFRAATPYFGRKIALLCCVSHPLSPRLRPSTVMIGTMREQSQVKRRGE